MALMLSKADTGSKPVEVRALLEYGADVDAAGGYGCTAPHYAAQAENPALINLLLEYGAKTELEDDAGNTPLITVVQNKTKQRSDAVSALLSGGADPNVTIGKSALTPLDRVVKTKDFALVKLLLRNGAMIKKSRLNHVVCKDNEEMIGLLERAIVIFRVLIGRVG